MTAKLMVLAAVAALGLSAQETGGIATAKIPFAFEANGKKLAAGEYRLQVAGSKAFIAIRHADTGDALFVANSGGNGNRLAGNQLVFHVYGDRYFLTSITDRKTGAVIRFPKSKAEKEMAAVVKAETVVRNAE